MGSATEKAITCRTRDDTGHPHSKIEGYVNERSYDYELFFDQ